MALAPTHEPTESMLARFAWCPDAPTTSRLAPVCSPFSRPSHGQWDHTIAWPRPERVAMAILEWVVCAQSWPLCRGSLPAAYLEAVPAHMESYGPCGLCRECLRQDRPHSERRTKIGRA